MSLETLSHISGILGFLAVIFTVFITYRKKLLRTGFTLFRDQYRAEMDDFKMYIRGDINMLREMMNENDERHTKTLSRIVEYYKKTTDSVTEQAGICKLIRVEDKGSRKVEDIWKKKMKDELDGVQKDVMEMKKSIEHIRKSVNGKT